MSDDLLKKQALYFVIRAIEEGGQYDFYDGLPIDREIADILYEKTNLLLYLVDEHLEAKRLGDFDKSNQILMMIANDEILNALAAYFLNSDIDRAELHERLHAIFKVMKVSL